MTQTKRLFDCAYDWVGNRKWTKHDSGSGDVLGYDFQRSVNAVKLDVPNPDTTVPRAQNSAGAEPITRRGRHVWPYR